MMGVRMNDSRGSAGVLVSLAGNLLGIAYLNTQCTLKYSPSCCGCFACDFPIKPMLWEEGCLVVEKLMQAFPDRPKTLFLIEEF